MEKNRGNTDHKTTPWSVSRRIILLGSKRRIMVIGSILALILITAIVYIVVKNGHGKYIFTQYPPLVQDSLITQEKPVIKETTSDSINTDTVDYIEQEEMDIFRVNTSYDELKFDSISALNQSQTAHSLFEKLLLPDDRQGIRNQSIHQYLNREIATSRSILKLIATIGKNILVDQYDRDGEEILMSLTESADITGVIITNRNGIIVSSTDRKHLNSNVRILFPNLDMEGDSLNWVETSNQVISSIPIYHTFGRIGTGVLITNN